MEDSAFPRGARGRGWIGHEGRARPLSRNKHWSAADGGRSQSHTPESERWERGGHFGGGRGRGHLRGTTPRFCNASLRLDNSRPQQKGISQEVAGAASHVDVDERQEAANGEDALDVDHDMAYEEEEAFGHIQEPELETQEDRDRFYQEAWFFYVLFLIFFLTLLS